MRGDILLERAVDQALLRSALLPDAGVGAAFDEDRVVVAGHGADVAGEDGERGVPGGGPCGVGGGEVRAGRGVGRGRSWRGALLGAGEGGNGGECGGERGLLEEIAAEQGRFHAHQCKTGRRRLDRAERNRLAGWVEERAAMRREVGVLPGCRGVSAAADGVVPRERAQAAVAGNDGPVSIWVSEIMLQQTRVAAVIAHYEEFMRRFPTLVSLALATEPEVLAAWSGLGYYNRARMLHKAAQFILEERKGQLPGNSAELRTLPGIGDYTAAAIASIAFGEGVAVVDGNVERVVLRLTGNANDGTKAMRRSVRAQAQALMAEAAGAMRGGRGEASAKRSGIGARIGERCGRAQPGDDGAGGDGVLAARAAVQRMSGVRPVPDARRAREACAAAAEGRERSLPAGSCENAGR